MPMSNFEQRRPAGTSYVRPAAGGAQDIFQPRSNKVPLPLIERAQGIFQWDEYGNEYIDVSSGPVVSNIGHGNAHVAEAMARQARTMDFAYARVARHRPNIELTARIAALAGPGFERACLSSGGSEAIEIAIKFLRAYAVAFGEPSRTKVITCQPSYHGGTIAGLGLSGDDALKPFLDGFSWTAERVPAPLSYRPPANHTAESWSRACASALDDKIRELGPQNVLAFMIEPVGGLATGCNVPTPEYFRLVREICRRNGIKLVFDEVMCGTGRTGRFLAAHNWPDALPDIVVMAKGLASGYTPLGATLLPAAMVDALAERTGFGFSHTYAANPISCATAMAVLDEYERFDLIRNARETGAYLKAGVLKLAGKSRIIGDVRGMGMLYAVEIVADKATRRPLPARENPADGIRIRGLDNGLLIYARRTAGGRNGDWFMLSPPLTIAPAECDELLRRLARTIDDYEAYLQAHGHI
jgi:adenosylmethionine-8-amino-7-oxononanoate aminotransferase